MPADNPLAYLTEPYRRARDFTGRHILPTLDAASQLNPLTHLANRLRAPAGQALERGMGALAPAMANLPAIGPTAPLAAAGQAMAPTPAPAPSAAPAGPQAAPATIPAAPQLPEPAPRALAPQAGGNLAGGPTGAVSSGVKTPPPGRGAGEYQYGDLTEGGESAASGATMPPAEAGAPSIGPDTDLAEAQRALNEYYSGVVGTGAAERRAQEMRRIAGSMRGRSTGRLDWGSQLSDALRGGIEGYTTYKGLQGDEEREAKLEELRQRLLAARMRGGGGAEQLSGPGME